MSKTLTTQERIARAMSEKELVQNILDLARALDYLAYHSKDSRWSEPGFPDIILVGRGRVIAIECKAEEGKLRGPVQGHYRVFPGQQDWLDAFQKGGAEAYLFRPSSWLDGSIERVLKGVTM